MLQDSGRSVRVSVSVLIRIFTFELQSECSTNMFHFSVCFCTVRFGFNVTANL